MSDELVLIDREALLAELRIVFDARTAEALLRVLDKVAVQVRQAGVTREDFHELKQIVADLAEAQRRNEERMGSLESALERLAEAQRCTEERMGSLESAFVLHGGNPQYDGLRADQQYGSPSDEEAGLPVNVHGSGKTCAQWHGIPRPRVT